MHYYLGIGKFQDHKNLFIVRGMCLLIKLYVPTEDKDILEEDMFYMLLKETREKARQKINILVIVGDWNARVEKDTRRRYGHMGKYRAE